MSEEIRIGIVGYGNIGKGVESSLKKNPDMCLEVIFTRRNPAELVTQSPNVPVEKFAEAEKYRDKLDVAILCGGSATDLPEHGPHFATIFNTVDSFDTHAKIPEYFATVNEAAKKAQKISIISTGWDPGLFSIIRLYSETVLPDGKDYTFWGPGVSQGHSDAIRRIPGVKDARQYTIPITKAVDEVRSGTNPDLTARDKHLRDCYVVAEPGAGLEKITHDIVKMPHYFSDYDTQVTFISAEEMKAKHSKMPHGGFLIRTGKTSAENKHLIEFSLKLDSNPEFAANVLVAYARAAFRMNREGQSGAKTVFDIAPSYLSTQSGEILRHNML